MKRCLKIVVSIKVDEALRTFLQKQAAQHAIEGTVHIPDKETVSIIACGESDNLDLFLDEIYKGHRANKPLHVEIEPFLKDKDYRGVFRIIE